MSHPARILPPLNELLERRKLRALTRRLRRDIVVSLCRELLQEERLALAGHAGEARSGAVESRSAVARRLEVEILARAEALLQPRLRTVLNASGVLLHTNLGRARLSAAAAGELERVGRENVALEIDLESGQRHRRHARIERWLQLLTGAEAGLVVNNGAAAIWLAVEALARRRRAIISRGELVAIGGSFRMPELLKSTGAKIVEVGTTNRTNMKDYARELREGDLILKVHPSNYRVEGFTEAVDLPELARLSASRGASLIFDAGSGSLYNFGKFKLSGEVPIRESLRQGADLVSFSGDKLLGGPQAGLIVGRRALVDRLARHPLQRALRCDKLNLAALEATLLAYAAADGPPDLPLMHSLATTVAQLRRRATQLKDRLLQVIPEGWEMQVRRSSAAIGGGSFAGEEVPSVALVLRGPSGREAAWLARSLRRGAPAVLTRVAEDAVHLDLRSLAESELPAVGDAIRRAFDEGGEDVRTR
jgi:L-seryl-tRNA(Ser) seleniumtransferase